MTWNKKKDEAHKPVDDAAEPSDQHKGSTQAAGKGHPTPKRKDAQAQNLHPLVPADRKASAKAAKARIRCPLLDSNDQCVLYDYRPITCRLYGIPTAIGGKGHVCGQSNFAAGASYPTVHLDKIQERLDRLSVEIRDRVQSRFKELHEVFVPVSMALLTNYDDAYLGIGPAPKES